MRDYFKNKCCKLKEHYCSKDCSSTRMSLIEVITIITSIYTYSIRAYYCWQLILDIELSDTHQDTLL